MAHALFPYFNFLTIISEQIKIGKLFKISHPKPKPHCCENKQAPHLMQFYPFRDGYSVWFQSNFQSFFDKNHPEVALLSQIKHLRSTKNYFVPLNLLFGNIEYSSREY